MKTEGETAPAPQSATSTPTPSYTTTQWGNAQIPIDPALQQQSTSTTPYQHYQAYTSHYPQAAYPSHYQSYAPPPMTAQPPPQQARQVGQAQQSSSSGGMDTADIATLNDALGSAGVDLRAEEESLQLRHDPQPSYRTFADRTRKQPPPPAPTFDTRFLAPTMRTHATPHKITKIPDDAVNYLALALRTRLRELVEGMVKAARHRTDTGFDRPASFYEDSVEGAGEEGTTGKGTPMWRVVVRSDVAKQLAVLERVEREEELKVRRERKERADMAAAHAAALAAQANGNGANSGGGMDWDDGEGVGGKKKRKKEGPGVTARNMSEDVRKKMSNAVATQAAGLGGKYAWMNAANAGGAAKAKPAAAAATTVGTGSTMGQGSPATTTVPQVGAGGGGAGSTWARPYVPTKKQGEKGAGGEKGDAEDLRLAVTIRDAMFVVERERGHGGGRGAARGWV